jgi:hypothetical protein
LSVLKQTVAVGQLIDTEFLNGAAGCEIHVCPPSAVLTTAWYAVTVQCKLSGHESANDAFGSTGNALLHVCPPSLEISMLRPVVESEPEAMQVEMAGQAIA